MRRWLVAGCLMAAVAACGSDKPKQEGPGGAGGGGGSGGSASGCDVPAQCSRLWDCDCVPATCVEAADGSKSWQCPIGHPVQGDHCPSAGAECQLDSGANGECPGRTASDPRRGMGACCGAQNDCATGLACLGGYCTWNCTDSTDCAKEVATPSPFAAGTALKCMDTPAGGFCMPGSGKSCSAPGDCDASEVCSLAVADPNSKGVSSTRCLARYTTTETLQPGDLCNGTNLYECPQPATVGLGVQSDGRTISVSVNYGCRAGVCAAGCEAGGQADCGEGLSCQGVFDWYQYVLNHPIQGTPGACLGPTCGQLTFANQQTQTSSVTPDACGEGQVCSGIDDWQVGVRLTCHEPEAGAEVGGECEAQAFFEKPCSTGFCLQRYPDEASTGKSCNSSAVCPGGQICVDTTGDGTAHCTPRGDPGYCANVCSTDGDCGDDTHCMIVVQGVTVANLQGTSYVPMCAKKEYLAQYYGRDVCESESDCTALGEGCSFMWGRSSLGWCRVQTAANTNGTRCQNDAGCRLTERCVGAPDGQTAYCTDVSKLKAVGSACAANEDCRSGLCLDSDRRGPASGRNTFCSAPCNDTLDCNEGMACRTLPFSDLTGNFFPVQPDLDSRVGLCVSLAPSAKSAICAKDADCPKGLSCDMDSGNCRDQTAALGDTCRLEEHCPSGTVCDFDLRRCVIPGCDPAMPTSCPDGTICQKGLGPVSNCVPAPVP
jgi:hypothetical protein